MSTSKEEFIELLLSTKRAGVDQLINFLLSTDFFEAPASTRFHGSYEGGLVDHSLNVYDTILQEYDNFKNLCPNANIVLEMESLILVALLHDLCKINTYEKTIINVPPNKTKSKKWEQQEGYIKKEQYMLGHSSKSIVTALTFVTLSEQEIQAIYWHMGGFDISPYSTLNDMSSTFEENLLAFLLHQADMKATYIIENERY